MWKNLSKLFLGVMACMSVAFSGVAADALQVNADTPSSNPYDPYPLGLGLFDVVDSANGTVIYQTGKLYLDNTSSWSLVGSSGSYRYFRYTLPSAGTMTGVDFYSSGAFEAYPRNQSGWTRSISVGGDYISLKTDEVSSVSALQTVLGSDPMTVAYKLGTPIVTVPIDEVLDYPTFEDVYSEGFSDGVSYATSVTQTVTLNRLNNEGGFHVQVLVDDGYVVDQDVNAYAPYVTFTRPAEYTAQIIITSNDVNRRYVQVNVVTPSYTNTLTNAYVYNGTVWLPTWFNPLVLDVGVTDAPDFDQCIDWQLDPDAWEHVYVGVDDYQKGYSAGQQEADAQVYQSGYSDGRSVGYSNGYGDGRSIGYAEGYSYAADNNVGSPTMINLWPLMSAVISMPFTFFQNGLDWTLFEGSPYEFSVSVFFGSLFVILMMWKIVQLIWRFGK